MKFSSTTILLALLTLSSAGPITPKAKRALTAQSYSEFQVSDGVAGNALAEVNAKFPVCMMNRFPFRSEPKRGERKQRKHDRHQEEEHFSNHTDLTDKSLGKPD